LFLVSALSNRWGIHRAKEGVSVWFEIQGDRRPADATAPTEDTPSDGWAGIGLRRGPRATDPGGWP